MPTARCSGHYPLFDPPRCFMRNLGFFPLLICGYALYYLFDVWGGKFETVGYGALCVALVLVLAAALAGQTAFSGNRPGGTRGYSARGLITLALLALYAVGQSYIGFPVATLVLAAALLWWLDYRRPVPWALASLGLAALAYVILVQLLKVPVPMGPFES